MKTSIFLSFYVYFEQRYNLFYAGVDIGRNGVTGIIRPISVCPYRNIFQVWWNW